jgi:biotin transport system substrate-specific component
MRSSSLHIRRLVLCALFAALTAVCSQLQIPLPMVPINLALFAVHLSGALLGPAYGFLSMAIYVLLGAAGLPVFTGLAGGMGVLLGKTGGYILGYCFCAAFVGLWSRRTGHGFVSLCAGMALGLCLCYLFGTLWFMRLSGLGLYASLGYCVLPFLPGDAVKIALAALLARRLEKPMKRIAGI